MATQYIVNFTSSIDNITTDGFAELSKTNIPTLTVRTCKDPSDKRNQTLLLKFMTNDFAIVSFDDNKTTCNLSYKNYYSNEMYNSTITFDSSSSSAYSNFKKTFNEYYNSKYETEYYKNGREWYVGEVLYKKDDKDAVIERIPNGTGTFYYDLPLHKIKYSGEFENGECDGSGTFYNTDGRITIKANNISNGVPTQKGKLYIKYSKKQEVIEIVFKEVWEKLGLSTKECKKSFVSSESFVNNVALLYWKKDDISMEELIFEDKTLDEKYMELWKIIKCQEASLNTMNDNNLKQIQQQITVLRNHCIVSTLLIIFTTIMVGIFN
jgi:hypothetical protein